MRNYSENDTLFASEEHTQPYTFADTLPLNRCPADSLAKGHKRVRKILGSDKKNMDFDSEAVYNFRTYMANTILSIAPEEKCNGTDLAHHANSNGSIQFSANGTFIEVLSDHVSNPVETINAVSSKNHILGCWEVAALPTGMLVILMYSTDPKMVKDAPNGFLPFVVARHTENFVALPGGAGYYRTVNNCSM